jgi:hypothetical protein
MRNMILEFQPRETLGAKREIGCRVSHFSLAELTSRPDGRNQLLTPASVGAETSGWKEKDLQDYV